MSTYKKDGSYTDCQTAIYPKENFIYAITILQFVILILLFTSSNVFARKPYNSGYNMNDKIEKTDEEWKEVLTPEQYRVMREKGTERAFTGEYWQTKDAGVYLCAACGLELFNSESKYKSGTGWPSFWQPVKDENVSYATDKSLGVVRGEILCSRCDAHLGHVFNDGPEPTGLRYCVNSISLKLVKEAKSDTAVGVETEHK